MRHFNILAAVAATMLMGGVAIAKDKPEGASKEKKICRTEGDSTSRIAAKRICRTKAEWEGRSSETQRDAARAVDSMSRRN
jgi:hypothetical protein